MTEITIDEIKQEAIKKISSGFNGHSIIAFVDLLGFSRDIMTNWENHSNDPLFRLMKIKSFVEVAIQKAGMHQLEDHQGNIVMRVHYPRVITFSDSFIFLKEIENDDPNSILSCVLAVIGSIIELWKISLDEGFTIRGGIDLGKIFYTKNDLVGPTLINSHLLESKIANYSRIILSTSIRRIIMENINKINPVLSEYYERFIIVDNDNHLSINPLIAFGYNRDGELDKNINKFIKLQIKAKTQKEKMKYTPVIKILKKRDRNLLDRHVFFLDDGRNLNWLIWRFKSLINSFKLSIKLYNF